MRNSLEGCLMPCWLNGFFLSHRSVTCVCVCFLADLRRRLGIPGGLKTAIALRCICKSGLLKREFWNSAFFRFILRNSVLDHPKLVLVHAQKNKEAARWLRPRVNRTPFGHGRWSIRTPHVLITNHTGCSS